MGKIKKLNSLLKILDREKKLGKKVGYVIGYFDVLHEGHINLLNFVKNYVDILVIGIGSDKSIRISKGENRPINQIDSRLLMVANLKVVDYAFDLGGAYKSGSPKALKKERSVVSKIKPDVISTAVFGDSNWQEKLAQAEELGAEFIGYYGSKVNSSSKIIAKLGLEI